MPIRKQIQQQAAPFSFDTGLFQEYKSLVIKQARERQKGPKTLMELSRTKLSQNQNGSNRAGKRYSSSFGEGGQECIESAALY